MFARVTFRRASLSPDRYSFTKSGLLIWSDFHRFVASNSAFVTVWLSVRTSLMISSLMPSERRRLGAAHHLHVVGRLNDSGLQDASHGRVDLIPLGDKRMQGMKFTSLLRAAPK
jgi:hypothetical protein